jgi:hypothetical protein
MPDQLPAPSDRAPLVRITAGADAGRLGRLLLVRENGDHLVYLPGRRDNPSCIETLRREHIEFVPVTSTGQGDFQVDRHEADMEPWFTPWEWATLGLIVAGALCLILGALT